MPSDQELQGLARQAREEIQRTSERVRRAAPKRSNAGWRALVAWTALIALILVGETHTTELALVIGKVVPGSAVARVGKELGGVLDQARTAIENARDVNGSLPEAIPHAALAAVVRYDRAGNRYRLSAASAGVTASLDSDGNREIRRN